MWKNFHPKMMFCTIIKGIMVFLIQHSFPSFIAAASLANYSQVAVAKSSKAKGNTGDATLVFRAAIIINLGLGKT
jgi:hypothetical protein